MDEQSSLHFPAASDGSPASSPVSTSSELNSESEGDSLTSDHARAKTANEPFCEQAIRMRIIIGKLAQISAAIRKSGSKYRNQRADAALTDENRAELEAHFRFILAIGLRDPEPNGSELTTDELLRKALCVDELTTVQKRLVRANSLRQNRIEFVRASPGKISEETEDDKRPRVSAPRAFAPAETAQPKKRDAVGFAQASSMPTPVLVASSNAKTATDVGSKLEIKTIMAKATPSVTTKVTQNAEMQDYPQRPIAEGEKMVQCPYCGDSLSPEDLKTDRRWR